MEGKTYFPCDLVFVGTLTFAINSQVPSVFIILCPLILLLLVLRLMFCSVSIFCFVSAADFHHGSNVILH